MPIQEISAPTGPSLQHIGIHVQTTAAQQTPAAAASEAPQIDQQERLTLAGLQLQQVEPAYLVVPGARRTPLVIDPRRLGSEPLMSSLQQLGRRLDLDTALNLQQAAQSLIASMRQQGELTEQGPLKLVLTGVFGEIELDLERLQPDTLREAFSSGLQEQPAGHLQQIHGQLSTLSQLVRAGFAAGDESQLQNWMQAVMAPTFEPSAFFEQALGFSPLNQESSVRNLLQGIGSVPETPPPHQGGEAEPLQLELLLDERSRALVEAANRLEDELELAPTPDSPDIMDLLRAFQAILRQLDNDVNALLKAQNDVKKFERKVLASFAERLHRDLNFSKEKLDQLHQSSRERLQLLIDQAVTQVQAKVELLGAAKRR